MPLHLVHIMREEGDNWEPAHCKFSPVQLEYYLEPGCKLPTRGGCCSKWVEFFAVRLKDGRVWDQENRWHDASS